MISVAPPAAATSGPAVIPAVPPMPGAAEAMPRTSNGGSLPLPSPPRRGSLGGNPFIYEDGVTSCQYFELSPRQSLESPASHRRFSDENRDPFHSTKQSPRPTIEVKAGVGPHSSRKALAVPNYADQPCLRPPSPQKEQRRTAGVQQHSSAGTPGPRVSTPQKDRRKAGTPHHYSDAGTPGGRSFRDEDLATEFSVGSSILRPPSEASVSSRISQLSRRTTTKQSLSTKELQNMEIAQKKEELKKLMRRNERNMQKALGSALSVASAGRKQCSKPLTEPKEFSLSAPPTPKGSRREVGMASVSSCASVASQRSLRRDSFGGKRPTATATTPRPASPGPRSSKLCYPTAPELSTAQRSGRRQSYSCPPEEDVRRLSAGGSVRARATPRAPTPERAPRAATPERAQPRRATPERTRPNPSVELPCTAADVARQRLAREKLAEKLCRPPGAASSSTSTFPAAPKSATHPLGTTGKQPSARVGSFGSTTPRVISWA